MMSLLCQEHPSRIRQPSHNISINSAYAGDRECSPHMLAPLLPVDFFIAIVLPRAYTWFGMHAAGRPRPGGGITLKLLIDEGILFPGENVLTVEYKSNITYGSLAECGRIKCTIAGTELTFESPSAFSIYLKRLINPARKADDGWKTVKFEGKVRFWECGCLSGLLTIAWLSLPRCSMISKSSPFWPTCCTSSLHRDSSIAKHVANTFLQLLKYCLTTLICSCLQAAAAAAVT